MHQPHRIVDRRAWRNGRFEEGARAVPEEAAVALTYNGGTYAVMMATPQDLTDFAIGFSLSEGVVRSPRDVLSLDIIDLDDGIELRMWLAQERAELVNERRRLIAGPTGCGLCGIDSIAEAVRPAAIVARGRAFAPRDVMAAPSMRLHSGRRRTASLHSARTSGATTRWTSWPVRWRGMTSRQATAWWC